MLHNEIVHTGAELGGEDPRCCLELAKFEVDVWCAEEITEQPARV